MIIPPPGGFEPNQIPPNLPDSEGPSNKKADDQEQPDARQQPGYSDIDPNAKLVKEGSVSPKQETQPEKDVKKAEGAISRLIDKLPGEKGLRATEIGVKLSDGAVALGGDAIGVVQGLAGKAPEEVVISPEDIEGISDALDKVEGIATTSLFLFYIYKSGERFVDFGKLEQIEKAYQNLQSKIDEKTELLKTTPKESTDYQQISSDIEALQGKLEQVQKDLTDINDKLAATKHVHSKLIKYSLKEGKVIAKFAGREIAAQTLGTAVKVWKIKMKAVGINADVKKRGQINKELKKIGEMIVNERDMNPELKKLLKLKLRSDTTLYSDTCLSTLTKSIAIGGYSAGITSTVSSITLAAIKAVTIFTGVVVSALSAMALLASGILTIAALGIGATYVIHKNRHNINIKHEKVKLSLQNKLVNRKISKITKKSNRLEEIQKTTNERLNKFHTGKKQWGKFKVTNKRNVSFSDESGIADQEQPSQKVSSINQRLTKLIEKKEELKEEIASLTSEEKSSQAKINPIKRKQMIDKKEALINAEAQLGKEISKMQKDISKYLQMEERQKSKIDNAVSKANRQMSILIKQQESLQAQIKENQELSRVISLSKSLNLTPRETNEKIKDLENKISETTSDDSIAIREHLKTEGFNISDAKWESLDERRALLERYLVPKK
ncbi:MAG: hypothetical protein VX777_05905 [Chlamydiota bacterium]|nr:hypothetical protein [Chlamydiota bacterium]